MSSPISLTQIAKASAEWESTYILAADVIGIEIMENGYQRYKRGDGVTAWSALPYLDRIYFETSEITVDTALSSTSTNPVQNKAVKAALDGKASSSHEHAAGDITSGTLSVARGGTGKSSWTTNRLVYPTSGTVLGQLAFPTTAGSFLRQGTSGAPYWSKPADVLSAIGGVIKSDTGWLQYDSTTYPSVRYRVANDVVYVRGFSSATTPLAANTYTKVGYIPGNYWADEELYFSANSLGGGKQIDGMIDSEGNIKLYVTSSTSYWAFTFSYPIA